MTWIMKYACDMCGEIETEEKNYLVIYDMSEHDEKNTLNGEYYFCSACRKKLLNDIKERRIQKRNNA